MSEVIEQMNIFTAIVEEDTDALKKKIKEGFADDLNDGGWTPLMQAVYEDNFEACELLIKAGADINALYESTGCSDYSEGDDTRCTALSLAIYHNRLEISELLIKAGAEVDSDHYVYTYDSSSGMDHHDAKSCLLMAMEMGDINLRRLLIEAGACIDYQMTGGQTALGYAIQNEKLYWIEQFLTMGANAAQDVEHEELGEVPALIAALRNYFNDGEKEQFNIVKRLYQAGGLRSFVTPDGDSLIEWILESEDEELIALFGLEWLVETIAEARAESEVEPPVREGREFTLNPATLLPVVDPRFEPPTVGDLRALMPLLKRKMGLSDVVRYLDVDQRVFFEWIDGDRRLPYPVWHLIVKLALTDERTIISHF